MSKVIVGLTGGIGSGKSEVAKQLGHYGISVIDSDVISREIIQNSKSVLKKIIQHFGESVLDAKGKLDRDQLRAIIFTQPKEKIWLEKLLHPLIIKKMLRHAKQAQSLYCVFVLPLLLEAKLAHLVDYVLVIDTTKQLQIERTKKSKHYSHEEILAILKSQASRKDRLAIADKVIKNTSSLSHLRKQVAQWHSAYLNSLIKKQGNLYSEQLGIKLSNDDREIFKWFLASILYGKHISEQIASKTYEVFRANHLISPKAILKAGWDKLVRVLDKGGYARYDFSTATKLLAICKKLEKDYGGSLNQLHAKAKNSKDLELLLLEFPGIGPITTHIFLREMRVIWSKANPEILPIVKKTAKRFNIEIENLNRKTKSFMRLECALFRLRKY